jgi:hypothetical protein
MQYRIQISVRSMHPDHTGQRPGFHMAVEGDHADEQRALEYGVGMARVLAKGERPAKSRSHPFAEFPRLRTTDAPPACPRCGHQGDGPFPWWGNVSGMCTLCNYPEPNPDWEEG